MTENGLAEEFFHRCKRLADDSSVYQSTAQYADWLAWFDEHRIALAGLGAYPANLVPVVDQHRNNGALLAMALRIHVSPQGWQP